MGPLRQRFGREVDGLGSGEDRPDEFGRQESQQDQVAYVAIGDAFGLGDLDERSGAAARERPKPLAATNDRLDEGRVDSGTARATSFAREDESHLDSTASDASRDHVADDCAFSTKKSR